MKIYTKKGDGGETALFGGQKVRKSSLRIESYGTVDELNSVLGMAISHPLTARTKELIEELQHQLFILGSDLATPMSKKLPIDRISQKHVTFLEETIDDLDEYLTPLKHFILPGGSMTGSILHFARTVCRRAERLTVDLSQQEEISPTVLQYLNRLSDFLFILARFENHNAGQEETPWKSRS